MRCTLAVSPREGTWAAAARELAELWPKLGDHRHRSHAHWRLRRRRYGWGYDVVDFWAPTRALWGLRMSLRAFVDAAHGAGIGVILDVVYNHAGADGNYLAQFSGRLTSADKYPKEWGEPFNSGRGGELGTRPRVHCRRMRFTGWRSSTSTDFAWMPRSRSSMSRPSISSRSSPGACALAGGGR